MRIVTTLVAAIGLLVSPASAGSLNVQKDYKLTGSFRTYDKACTSALKSVLEKAFEGVEKVQMNAPAITAFSAVKVTTATFTGTAFSGRHGGATGTIVCIFPNGSSRPSDIELTFEGRGLPGFLKHPLAAVEKDPARRRALSYATTVSE